MERTRLRTRPAPLDILDDEAEEVRVNSADTAADVDYSSKGRSRLTNGSTLLAGVDGRSSWSRRFRDLVELYANDLGGEAVASEAQRSLIRRAATLSIQLEQLEAAFATAGAVDTTSLDLYLRSASLLHRVLASLGLEKTGDGSRPVHHADPTTNAILDAIRAGRRPS